MVHFYLIFRVTCPNVKYRLTGNSDAGKIVSCRQWWRYTAASLLAQQEWGYLGWPKLLGKTRVASKAHERKKPFKCNILSLTLVESNILYQDVCNARGHEGHLKKKLVISYVFLALKI